MAHNLNKKSLATAQVSRSNRPDLSSEAIRTAREDLAE